MLSGDGAAWPRVVSWPLLTPQGVLMSRIVWTFGLIAAGILSAMMAVTMLVWRDIGFDNGAVIGYTTMVVAFLMIYFGIRSYRDNVAGGTVRFGRAFKVGFLIMLIGVAGYVA